MNRLLTSLTALIALGGSIYADEQVRRIQEELRKRNLYFGEIDGQKTKETTRALRHYQERKGFKPTGVPDADTLNALNLEDLAISAVPSPGFGERSWPDVPVLKSDAARRVREEDRKYLESLEPIAEPPADMAGTLAATPDGSGPATSRSSSAATERFHRLDRQPPPPSRREADSARQQEGAGIPPEKAKNLVQGYLKACETNRLSAETAYYADRVNYFDHGTVNRKFIERDVSAFYRRWPEREYRLLEVKVLHADHDESLIRFRIAFHYRSPKHVVSGKTDNFFTVQETRDGMKFTSMREKRLRDSE